jgi:hypothetical protein
VTGASVSLPYSKPAYVPVLNAIVYLGNGDATYIYKF